MIIQLADDPGRRRRINKWAMEDFGGFSRRIYPTTHGHLQHRRSFNGGSYCDPKADKLINARSPAATPTR